MPVGKIEIPLRVESVAENGCPLLMYRHQ